jgi:hypothetical protein
MVKYVKYKGKGSSGTVHKVSEKEYADLKARGEKLEVVKSVTRTKKNDDFFGVNAFRSRKWF